MRAHSAILAVSLSLLAGCDKSPRDRLQGRCLGESTENVPPEQLAKATGWVKGTAPARWLKLVEQSIFSWKHEASQCRSLSFSQAI